MNGKSGWYKQLYAESPHKHLPAIVVDFDGTIAEDAYPDIGQPMPNVKEAFESLMAAGYEIVVYSCRTNLDKGRDAAAAQKAKMHAWLVENQIPFTRIEEGWDGKPHSKFYIDNKNIPFGGKFDWHTITDAILRGYKCQ